MMVLKLVLKPAIQDLLLLMVRIVILLATDHLLVGHVMPQHQQFVQKFLTTGKELEMKYVMTERITAGDALPIIVE